MKKIIQNRIFIIIVAYILIITILVLFGMYTNEIQYANSIVAQNSRYNGVALFPYDDTNLQVMDTKLKEEYQSTNNTYSFYNGYRGYVYYSNAIISSIVINNEKKEAHTLLINDTMLDNSFSLDINENLLNNNNEYIPVVLGGKKFSKVKPNQIVDIELLSETTKENVVVKGIVAAKYDIEQAGIPEYYKVGFDYYESFLDGIIMIADNSDYEVLIEDRNNRIMLLANFVNEDEFNGFMNNLYDYGVPSLTYSNPPYISYFPAFITEKQEITLIIYSIVFCIALTLLLLVINKAFESKPKKVLNNLMPFISVIACLAISYLVLFVINATNYPMNFLYPLLLLIIPTIILLGQKINSRIRLQKEKKIKEAKYEKI